MHILQHFPAAFAPFSSSPSFSGSWPSQGLGSGRIHVGIPAPSFPVLLGSKWSPWLKGYYLWASLAWYTRKIPIDIIVPVSKNHKPRACCPACGVQLFLCVQQAPLGQLPTIPHSLRSPRPTLPLPPTQERQNDFQRSLDSLSMAIWKVKANRLSLCTW